jgi:PTH1 family peptidyl-tRNA hydrolase
VGIGRPRHEEAIERFVLSGFYADQQEAVGRVVATAADCLEIILAMGPEEAMQRFHRAGKEEVEG